MAVRPRTDGGKALRLACWNCDGVRDRKLELEQFLTEHSFDICLMNKTHLESYRAIRFANYVSHRTDHPTREGDTAIIARRGIDHYAAVLGLQHLEATAIHLVLASRPVKLVAVYLSPTRHLIESDPTECRSGGFPVLMAGDLNAEHTDRNSRLIRSRVSLLRDYANKTYCLIYGTDSPTTAPYTHKATPDVTDIVDIKDFVLPVHVTVCSALSSDHLPVLTDITCRSSIQNLLDGTDFARMDWPAFQACHADSRGIPW
jgi:hypothetical protein